MNERGLAVVCGALGGWALGKGGNWRGDGAVVDAFLVMFRFVFSFRCSFSFLVSCSFSFALASVLISTITISVLSKCIPRFEACTYFRPEVKVCSFLQEKAKKDHGELSGCVDAYR